GLDGTRKLRYGVPPCVWRKTENAETRINSQVLRGARRADAFQLPPPPPAFARAQQGLAFETNLKRTSTRAFANKQVPTTLSAEHQNRRKAGTDAASRDCIRFRTVRRVYP